ncbi:MAG: protein kinase [Candidatus Contendobacter sp.]|nr:protein kinase [Candidatus Contendobacter sp.]
MMTTPNSTPPAKSGSRRANALPSGCMLDEYRIDAILGAGGFGVTYKALDTHLENWVAIKEYFPVEWSFRDPNGITVHPNTQGQASNNADQPSDYVWGLERFLDEARVLARVQHPFVVRVKRYFRAHGTAYIVMDYEEGEPLSAILQDGEILGEDEVRGLLEDVLPALQAVHEQGFLHRDIKPSNLYVRSNDHRVILIDFGAAREAIGRHSKSVTSLVTPGYSPPEQYTTRNDRYGTWTDIYALGAVLYRCITGHTPMEAAERLLDDTLEPAVKVGAGRYSTNLLCTIDRALAVRPEHRFGAVAEMQAALVSSQDEERDKTVILTPLRRSGKPSVSPIPLPHLTQWPDQTVLESVAKQGDGLQGDGLQVVQPLIADSQATKVRHSVLQSSSGRKASRRRLLGVLAGSGILAALAAITIWLWPAPHEESPLPPADPTTAHTPAVAAPEPPPVVAESPPVVAESPPVTEAAPASPVIAEPPLAGSEPLPPALTLPPAPVQDSTADKPVEPAPIAPTEVEHTDAIPAPVPPSRRTPGLQEEGSAGAPGKAVTDKPLRRARQRAERKRRTQTATESFAPPVRAQPAPAPPKRPSYWDKPTDSGFNNK